MDQGFYASLRENVIWYLFTIVNGVRHKESLKTKNFAVAKKLVSKKYSELKEGKQIVIDEPEPESVAKVIELYI